MATAPAMAGPKIAGIDVSKYQGRIDWHAVGSTRVRFVIVRSTMGNRYVDPRFGRNVAGASANGLVVGAYHYAKPGRARWDARAEADHFLRVARNAPGDLLPVLDIEDAGGLTRSRLRAWARTWLERVHERTGLRAMIYSGSNFWQTSMGNTASFARRGHPHWVAHWYVRSPDLPGRSWGGRSWTFWQWSATGHIRGIRGDVDRNWFKGQDLTRATIASVTVAPAPGGSIVGQSIACGGRHDRCERLANPGSTLSLRARPEGDARFLRWTGACAAAGTSPTCSVTALGERTVSAIFGFAVTSAPSRVAAMVAPGNAASEPGGIAVCSGGGPECTVAVLLAGQLRAQRSRPA